MRVYKLSIFLTVILSFFAFQVNVSCEEINPLIKQTLMKKNLRWELFLPKDSLNISKKDNTVSIKIINPQNFQKLADEAAKVQLNKDYILSLKEIKTDKSNEVSSIEIQLVGNFVEIFSFYRENESKFIIDFWINEDLLPKKTVTEKVEVPKTVPVRKTASVKAQKTNYPKKFLKPKIADENYRDFRYGAAFVWNYPPLISKPAKLINLESKTPDYFYPIRDRKIIDTEKIAHLQLSINLYKRSQFGLMNKSIDLYFKKYGDQADLDLNEFLKACAILKLNISKPNEESTKFAINLLENISKRTNDYAFKKGILKYLLANVLNKNDYISTLKEARKLFYQAREFADVEMATDASSIILYSLAQLSQLDKIDEILKDPNYVKFLSEQEVLAYQTYILLSRDNNQEVINRVEKVSKSLIDPVHPGILYNLAESYFREGKYADSIKNFERFLKTYSFHKLASSARLRIALANDLLSKDPEKILSLYKEAIDNSSVFTSNYEARLRYVGFRCLRKKNLTEEDLESRTFLKLKTDEEKNLTEELKKLLWMVRLRNFIVDKNYNDALAYLNAIPFGSLKPFEQLSFRGDGGEIILGMVQSLFEKEDYPTLLKIYETYNEKFEKKISREPKTKYLIGKSMLKLGFYDMFDKNYEDFKLLSDSPKREFPLWIDRDDTYDSKYLMMDLAIIKNINLNNNEQVKKLLVQLEKDYPRNNRINYFKGILSFREENYKNTITYLEKFLSENKEKKLYDSSDILIILGNYTDSLYKIGDLDKYRRVSKALLEDTSSNNNSPQFKSLKERILYLNIEILAGEQKVTNSSLLEQEIKLFFSSFPQSSYKDRVSFLMGQSYIQVNKLEEGRKIMDELVKGDSVPNYLKELARSELSLIKIKNKTI